MESKLEKCTPVQATKLVEAFSGYILREERLERLKPWLMEKNCRVLRISNWAIRFIDIRCMRGYFRRKSLEISEMLRKHDPLHPEWVDKDLYDDLLVDLILFIDPDNKRFKLSPEEEEEWLNS